MRYLRKNCDQIVDAFVVATNYLSELVAALVDDVVDDVADDIVAAVVSNESIMSESSMTSYVDDRKLSLSSVGIFFVAISILSFPYSLNDGLVGSARYADRYFCIFIWSVSEISPSARRPLRYTSLRLVKS